jgi:hypothetical protein
MKIKNKVMAALHAGWMSGALVQIKRSRFNEARSGFVMDISEKWLLLNIVDRDFLQNDGYEALRLIDITDVEITTDWVALARERLGLEPVPQPDVLLIDLPGLLSSVDAHFPALGIEREDIDPEILHVGRIEKLKKKTVTLHEVGRHAEWHSEETQYRLKDITRVTFGNTYMKSLLEFARAQEAEAANGPDNRDSL